MNEDITASLYNIVTIQNIDTDAFEFRHNNVPYLLQAGEVKNFPKFIADLAVKHLIDRILEKQDHTGKSMANQAMRAELAQRIVRREERYARPENPSEEELVANLNPKSDLDKVLEKQTMVAEPEVVKTSNAEVFDGLKKEKINTKVGLIEYAKNTLGMNVDDPKTKEAFAKMTFTQLKKELDYKED